MDSCTISFHFPVAELLRLRQSLPEQGILICLYSSSVSIFTHRCMKQPRSWKCMLGLQTERPKGLPHSRLQQVKELQPAGHIPCLHDTLPA